MLYQYLKQKYNVRNKVVEICNELKCFVEICIYVYIFEEKKIVESSVRSRMLMRHMLNVNYCLINIIFFIYYV